MKRNSHNTHLNSVYQVLKKLGFLEKLNNHPSSPENPKEMFKNLSYHEIWKKCYSSGYYTLMFRDSSLIQCVIGDSNKYSFNYLECPYNVVSYSDFLAENGFDKYEESNFLEDEYNLYVSTASIRTSCTPIRYDFDPTSYKPSGHPASHFHIGYKNQIRIGIKKKLNLWSFVLFIIRQQYPTFWSSLIDSPKFEQIARNIREALDDIHVDHWSDEDEKELYFY